MLQSVERNANNNNGMTTSAKRRAGRAATRNESATSSALPKAPVSTPYTPKALHRDKSAPDAKPDIHNSSPDGGRKGSCFLYAVLYETPQW